MLGDKKIAYNNKKKSCVHIIIIVVVYFFFCFTMNLHSREWSRHFRGTFGFATAFHYAVYVLRARKKYECVYYKCLTPATISCIWIESVPQKKNRFSACRTKAVLNAQATQKKHTQLRTTANVLRCAACKCSMEAWAVTTDAHWLHTYNSKTCLLHLAIATISLAPWRTLLLINRAR